MPQEENPKTPSKFLEMFIRAAEKANEADLDEPPLKLDALKEVIPAETPSRTRREE